MRPLLSLLALAVFAAPLAGQEPVLTRRSMSGPRLGITVIGGSRADSVLRAHKLQGVMSQFGWHFEQQVVPAGGGPEFVVEEIVTIGGVEQHTAIPSATLGMGIRLPSGFEFGLGPNVTPMGTALMIGVGKSINYGGVSVPVNVALVRSPGALRVSFMIGYAVER